MKKNRFKIYLAGVLVPYENWTQLSVELEEHLALSGRRHLVRHGQGPDVQCLAALDFHLYRFADLRVLSFLTRSNNFSGITRQRLCVSLTIKWNTCFLDVLYREWLFDSKHLIKNYILKYLQILSIVSYTKFSNILNVH